MNQFKKIAILGLGLSGMAALQDLCKRGVEVIAWDDNEQTRDEAPDGTITPLTAESMQGYEALIAAPGIPDTHPAIQAARESGVEVICDIEAWHRLHPDIKTIGITGTNGKSTVTAMIHHVLQECGLPSQMGGNIGKAVFELNPPLNDEITVLELSSYQIERCPAFRPAIAVLLNITPDHLERHGTIENYAAIKARLFEGQGHAVIATDDDYCTQIAQMTQAAGKRKVARVSGSGSHNAQNINAVKAVAAALGLDADKVQHAIETFENLPHRQRPVRTVSGITFINDSKATNAVSTLYALRAFDKMVWIVGGQMKLGGLDGLENELQNVAHACIIGADTDPVARWLEAQGVAFTVCGTMDRAVTEGYNMAQEKGAGTVLLSPAGASFDQYKNFEQRGEDFERAVRGLGA